MTLDLPGITSGVVALAAILVVLGAAVALLNAKSIASVLVDRAADRLPESIREQYREEWRAEVYFGSRRTALRFAVSIWTHARDVTAETDQVESTASTQRSHSARHEGRTARLLQVETDEDASWLRAVATLLRPEVFARFFNEISPATRGELKERLETLRKQLERKNNRLGRQS